MWEPDQRTSAVPKLDYYRIISRPKRSVGDVVMGILAGLLAVVLAFIGLGIMLSGVSVIIIEASIYAKMMGVAFMFAGVCPFLIAMLLARESWRRIGEDSIPTLPSTDMRYNRPSSAANTVTGAPGFNGTGTHG